MTTKPTPKRPPPPRPPDDKVAKWMADQAIANAKLSSWLAVYGKNLGTL